MASGVGLPSALWVSQALDWELEKVPKAERQSILRLMQVFSEHSATPELPDDEVLRRAFKSVASAHIQQLHENAELRRRIEDLEATVEAERSTSRALQTTARGEVTTTKIARDANAALVEEWKKRCAGWKKNCMEAERKYKCLAALAGSKLELHDKEIQDAVSGRAALPDIDMEGANSTLAKLSDVKKQPVVVKPRAKMKPFRLGDDLNPPKSFGEREGGRRNGPKMPPRDAPGRTLGRGR